MRKVLNRLWLVVIVFSISLISCTKDKVSSHNTCGVSDPAKDIAWLQQEIDEVSQDEYAYYSMATYNGETVFFYGNCDPSVQIISKVRNCNGVDLGHQYELRDDLTDISIIWKHPNSNCDF